METTYHNQQLSAAPLTSSKPIKDRRLAEGISIEVERDTTGSLLCSLSPCFMVFPTSWKFKIPHGNVGKTIINHPSGNCLYHLYMVIWGWFILVLPQQFVVLLFSFSPFFHCMVHFKTRSQGLAGAVEAEFSVPPRGPSGLNRIFHGCTNFRW